MKKIILMIVLLSSVAAFGQQDMKDMPGMKMPGMKMPMKKKTTSKQVSAKKTTMKKATGASSSKVIYTCVMHPQIRRSAPGKCPICGMTLVKKTVKVAPAKASTKTQNNAANDMPAMMHDMKDMMHDMKDMMGDMKDMMKMMKDSNMQMGKQGMQNMEGMNMDTSQKMVDKVIYTCVMHPQVQQDKPGKCPICGMTLVKKTIKVPAVKQDRMKGMDMKGMDMKGNMQGMNMNQSNGPMFTGADPFNQISSTVSFSKPKTVRYDLFARDTMVNYTGKWKHAIALNGSIPAPTLYFTEGDTAEIYLHNMLKEESSLHWHGVILPNQADGVPFLTTAPVPPGETHLYKFRVVQNGTYWYHSHSALQEQIGMYGALIFLKRQEPQKSAMTMDMNDSTMKMESESSSQAMANESSAKDYNVVLSEWSDENPMQTQRRLRTGNDWFSIKKGSTQSYAEAIKAGQFKTKLVNEWKRMKAMDVSDDWYPKYLLNGLPERTLSPYKAGDKVRLHVVNAGASTYFWLGYAGGKITVVGNDGNDVVPVEVDRLIVAPAETYDLVVSIPQNMSYEFRATSEDRTGASSLWLGSGMKMPAPKLGRLKYFEGMKMMNSMMKTNGQMKDMGSGMSLQKMDMNMVMYPEMTGGELKDSGKKMQDMSNMPGMDMGNINMAGGDMVTLNYDMLRSPVKTTLPDGPMRTLHFTLTGNMNRYLWTMDNKSVTESDRILINKGENLRVIVSNNSMMRHPMHLHGHDFRMVNSQGEYSPLKNTFDVMPMESDTIEFAANKEGNWFFHCHILFHMMAGMGRVFTYANSPTNPELPNPQQAFNQFKHSSQAMMRQLNVRAGLESNGSDGEAIYSSNRYALTGLWHLGLKPENGYEGEVAFGRYLGVNQWWFPYVGFDYHYKKVEGNPENAGDYRNLFGQVSNKNDRKTFTAGIQYITPWLVLADARIDGNGKVRFQLSREDVPITQRLRLNFMGNTDKEYAAGLRYIISKWFALSSHYDSDMGLGAGITLTY